MPLALEHFSSTWDSNRNKNTPETCFILLQITGQIWLVKGYRQRGLRINKFNNETLICISLEHFEPLPLLLYVDRELE